jgi:6-phospho-beta-glucosidase
VKLWATFNETIVFIGTAILTAVIRRRCAIRRAPSRPAITSLSPMRWRLKRFVKAVAGRLVRQRAAAAYPLTDSAEDRQATDMADAIHTHWLYDPVLKGHYPESLLQQTQALWGFRACSRRRRAAA